MDSMRTGEDIYIPVCGTRSSTRCNSGGSGRGLLPFPLPFWLLLSLDSLILDWSWIGPWSIVTFSQSHLPHSLSFPLNDGSQSWTKIYGIFLHWKIRFAYDLHKECSSFNYVSIYATIMTINQKDNLRTIPGSILIKNFFIYIKRFKIKISKI